MMLLAIIKNIVDVSRLVLHDVKAIMTATVLVSS